MPAVSVIVAALASDVETCLACWRVDIMQLHGSSQGHTQSGRGWNAAEGHDELYGRSELARIRKKTGMVSGGHYIENLEYENEMKRTEGWNQCTAKRLALYTTFEMCDLRKGGALIQT
ncbi:hypothetical protein K438DRAFT_1751209 [Mycena galopus ATCC 62051]|nr:hypothetical protein K438DRAFT_1751209 [Mycena galopus ATCC 62051]